MSKEPMNGRPETPQWETRPAPGYGATQHPPAANRRRASRFPWRTWAGCCLWLLSAAVARPAEAEVQKLSVNGELNEEQARLVIQAQLKGLDKEREKALFATTLHHFVQAGRNQAVHQFSAQFDLVRGTPEELALVINGDGQIREVTGDGLQAWSIRQETNGLRKLVLRFAKTDKPAPQLRVKINAETEFKELPASLNLLTLAPEMPVLFAGYVRLDSPATLEVVATNLSGANPVEAKFLPKEMVATAAAAESQAFRFQGAPYSLPVRIEEADPESRQVVLKSSRLAGKLSETSATFQFNTEVQVKNPKGGSAVLLAGGVALTEIACRPECRIKMDQDRFVLVCDQAGVFPLQIKFDAAVQNSNLWHAIDFQLAPSLIQPVVLQGVAEDTQFRFSEGARPERTGGEFLSFAPPNGRVRLAWQEARKETEGKLFYAAQLLSHIAISPGLMHQTALLEGKVMQGEMNQLVLRLGGAGEVIRVQGAGVLAWKMNAVTNALDRQLLIQFNQPQKDQFALQVQLQTTLGAFPLAVEPVSLRPEGATRFAGHVRIVNQGAVRLEVLQAAGMSQISPEQFPETDATRALLRAAASHTFAYRFAGGEYQLRIQADHVVPELNVSQLATYHWGDTELAIDGELEVEVREAPIRELNLSIPKGFAIARLTAPELSDYFLKEETNQASAQLRLVYGKPITGRQMVQLRLERNKVAGETNWVLPRIEVGRAKAVRGHIGVSADPGYRLTATTAEGLTEIATAFFPRKQAGLQAAYRISETMWQSALRVERLPQSIQADALHLFSVGEGIAYGSSILNFLVSGAPMAAFKIALSNEYFNVEFTGKDIRNWQKTGDSYVVQLHTPVSGAYTLLATYERPFKARGETLGFTGARSLDAQTEQGHTIVMSTYQFQVKPVAISAGLLPLEPGEVPGEYRLFFDAPILAAYRYASRPFDLQLALSPLTQGETLNQVVDRALYKTRISKEGQVLTDVSYYVKNRGLPHLSLKLPAGAELWSAEVDGVNAVPIRDQQVDLIPLPQRSDPNAVHKVQLKLANRSKTARRVAVATPELSAPVMFAEWTLQPDSGQRLIYRRGSLTPAKGLEDISGFAKLIQLVEGNHALLFLTWLGMFLGMMIIGLWAWRLAAAAGVHKFTPRNISGSLLGLLALVLALVNWASTLRLAAERLPAPATTLSFLAPVQQAGSSLSLEVDNLSVEPSVFSYAAYAWPALLAFPAWIYSLIAASQLRQAAARGAAWTLLAWAALRWPGGAPAFLVVLLLCFLIEAVLPALWQLWKLPRKPRPTPPSPATPAAAALLLVWLGLGQPATAAVATQPPAVPVAESVVQEIRVENDYVFAKAAVRWTARKGQVLPLLSEPGVLTRMSCPTNDLKLIQAQAPDRPGQLLLALRDGTFEVEAQYQLQVRRRNDESGFVLPTRFGLINRVRLALADLEVDIASPQAVSVKTEPGTKPKETAAQLVLRPVSEPWIGWKPRSRDTRREKAVFFAEIHQLYVPSAGAVEGTHLVQVRPAQGELGELVLGIPASVTISDVFSLQPAAEAVDGKAAKTASFIQLWRFDPEERKLRINFSPPQARPFGILVRSQMSAGTLPFEQGVGVITADQAAGQVGLLAFATGPEVQLDNVEAGALAPINLEDFPTALLNAARTQAAELTLRRAFRYSDPKITASLKASAVEPDVRVEAQQTLSLGEDRTVLAVNLALEINRAGIFRFSFALPAGLEVESLTGAALSHWTELKTPEARIITCHLKGKTTGTQQFDIGLAGPGLRPVPAWAAPNLFVREAAKQRGQLVIVPEQGLRLQVGARDGVTQLDPQKSGIRQKGVMAFRLLQNQWNLALDLERVDPWIQASSLQHVVVSEAQLKVTANVQYQIENTGLKSLRVRLPADADSVVFQGDQVADFLKVEGPATGELQLWEVKMHRRIMGKYLLQATYQVRVPEKGTEAVALGVVPENVNLHRGFLTIQSMGRLQVQVPAVPATLQATEWQGIPKDLRQDLSNAPANFTFRLVESAWRLSLKLDRHDAARLLSTRVNSVAMTSVISDAGIMLTQVRMELVPGDQRLLRFKLTDDSRFWFAFVNQNGVWPWKGQDKDSGQTLIPLEPASKSGQFTLVELYYSSRVGNGQSRALDLQLVAPQFDLPLENISWNIYLGEKWTLKRWSGTLQLVDAQTMSPAATIDLNSYFNNEASQLRDKTREAEQMLQMGNSLLEKGSPQQARRAFQAAYGLSQHDNAFNEDARVQLHNLKLQQALVGLNVRQASVAGEAGAQSTRLRELRSRDEVAYTQQAAKEILNRTPGDENAALTRLAERLIQQQDAAISSPAAIRASIPEQGRLLRFSRTVQVENWANLSLHLKADMIRPASWGNRNLVLLATFVLLLLAVWLGRTGKA